MNAQKYGDDFFVVSFEGKNALDEFLIHMHFFQVFRGEEKGEKGTKIEKKIRSIFSFGFLILEKLGTFRSGVYYVVNLRKIQLKLCSSIM